MATKLTGRVRYSTRARRQLVRWLDESGTSPGKLGDRLGISQQAVSMWIRGYNRPIPPYRKALVRIAGIPEDDWLTADERQVAEAS